MSIIRKELQLFIAFMEQRLREHDDLPGWKKREIPDVLSNAFNAFNDLVFVVNNKEEPLNISRRCADVANLVMMIADLSGGLDLEPAADLSEDWEDEDDDEDFEISDWDDWDDWEDPNGDDDVDLDDLNDEPITIKEEEKTNVNSI